MKQERIGKCSVKDSKNAPAKAYQQHQQQTPTTQIKHMHTCRASTKQRTYTHHSYKFQDPSQYCDSPAQNVPEGTKPDNAKHMFYNNLI